MTSLPHLMLLMDSQKDEQQPMPVIPFMVEPVDLNSQGEDYKDILSELEGNLPVLSEEQGYLCDLLEKIHHKLHRNSNYAGFGEDSVETLNQIQAYLQAEEPVFSKQLCYRVFKELINFLECNFVNLHFYTEETMSSLYEELHSRIHSTVKQENFPFFGSVAWVPDVDLQEFQLLSPEDCVMDGDMLVKINSHHPKIALNFPFKSIGNRALANSATLEEIILPQGVHALDEFAFYQSIALRRVYLPRSIVKILESAFESCVQLEEIVLPTDVGFNRKLFKDCSSLKKVVLPENLHILREEIFSGCVSLEEIHLPKGLKKLEREVFSYTVSLKEITLPNTLETIGEEAFFHSGITKIRLSDPTPILLDHTSRSYIRQFLSARKSNGEYLP